MNLPRPVYTVGAFAGALLVAVDWPAAGRILLLGTLFLLSGVLGVYGLYGLPTWEVPPLLVVGVFLALAGTASALLVAWRRAIWRGDHAVLLAEARLTQLTDDRRRSDEKLTTSRMAAGRSLFELGERCRALEARGKVLELERDDLIRKGITARFGVPTPLESPAVTGLPIGGDEDARLDTKVWTPGTRLGDTQVSATEPPRPAPLPSATLILADVESSLDPDHCPTMVIGGGK